MVLWIWSGCKLNLASIPDSIRVFGLGRKGTKMQENVLKRELCEPSLNSIFLWYGGRGIVQLNFLNFVEMQNVPKIIKELHKKFLICKSSLLWIVRYAIRWDERKVKGPPICGKHLQYDSEKVLLSSVWYSEQYATSTKIREDKKTFQTLLFFHSSPFNHNSHFKPFFYETLIADSTTLLNIYFVNILSKLYLGSNAQQS